MRKTNAIVCKILLCFIIGVLLFGYLPSPANAGPKPTNLAASAITQTSATLTWTAASGTGVSYKVYKDGSIYTNSTTNTSISITGLTASTTYSFIVSAVKNGIETYSSAKAVTTLPEAPTGLAVSAITQTSATLTWTATAGATYKVYKNGSLYSSPTTNTASITNLTASTTYSFTVSAVKAGAEGTKSSVLSVTTLPAAPTGLVTSSVTHTSATLTWTATTGATSYKVYKDGSLYSSPTTNITSLTDLTASTTYSFEVSAVTAGGEGAKSTAKSLTTLLAVPAAPTGLAVSAITKTSAALTWTATTGATSYKVYKDGSLYASSTTNTASIAGLTVSTTYSFTVSAVNAGGEGAQTTVLPVTTLPAVLSGPTLKVLEVQPGSSFDLTTSLLSLTFPNNPIDLTQMAMPEFISKVDEINGKYDIVYIGNSSSGTQYSALGTAPTNLPQGGLNNGFGNSKEYYSDNDITNRRANTLKDFIDSKQLTIFDQTIFESRSTKPKLYDNFLSFTNNPTVPNFITGNIRNAGSENQRISLLGTAFSNYNLSNVAKKPVLALNSQPAMYDGTDASYQEVKSLGYSFDINNQTNAYNMTVKLYIDINGDGIFKATDNYAGKPELVYEMLNLNSDTGYTVNYHLPDSFVGLQPWKLELTDTSTGAKSYLTGSTAFRAARSGDEVIIRLLQLEPTGNTLSIYSLNNVSGQNLLFKDKVYRIQVTEMNVADFNAAYLGLQANQLPLPKSAKVNGVTGTAPTALNGNYDMVIMGFADMYGNGDLTNTNSINAVKNFINTNQSVMFTHDTLTFDVDSPNTWGYNITQNFRSIVGQQRYYRTAPDLTRYYDQMPNSSKDSYGFTNLTLARYNNGLKNDGNTFQTTTTTQKINDNLVTQFPFPLEEITVAATHFQYFQLDLEDERVVPVYTLTGASNTMYTHPGDGRNDYYTYTKGNITYSGTGHSKVNADNYIQEEKMFVNTIIKASRGANHAPTLEVNGIREGMDIANSLSTIDFNFKATDIDLNDPYLNADISLSSSTDGTNFSDYQNVQHHSASDLDLNNRVKSGDTKSISVTKAVDSSILAYKVKVEVYDSYGARVSQEIKLNNKQDPQISVQSFGTSCLVGDTITIPVNVTANATALHETFQNINLQGIMTNPDNTVTSAYSNSYPELIFSPNSSWTNNIQTNSYPLIFNTVGDYTILNKLTYSAYNGVPPNLSGLQSRENDQSFKISVASGILDVVVQDQKGRGITGIPLTVSGPHTGTTNTSGLFSLAGLSSGDYTVTVSVPEGRSIGSTSQTVTLSADSPYQKITFSMGGNLIMNPSIKSRSGETQLSTIRNVPLQANIGFNLTRPATSLTLDLNSNLSGSTTNVSISKVYCNSQEINFSNSSGKIFPSQSTTFPSGTYTLEATVSIVGGTMQVGQSFTVSLTQGTSAQDANTGSVETITSPSPLTVNVVPLIANPKITTHSGASQMSILKNVPLQVVAGFDLAIPASFLKVDMGNSLGTTMNVTISKVYCNNQEIGFSHSDGKLFPSQSTPFPSGVYTLNAIVTLNGVAMQEGQIFTVILTDLTSAQDAITGTIENINSVSLSLEVNVGASPNLH